MSDVFLGGQSRNPQLLKPEFIETMYGSLHVWEDFESSIGFRVLRLFTIQGVPIGGSRGGHAHRSCLQALSCVSGAVTARIQRYGVSSNFRLTPQSGILVLPSLTWLDLIEFEDSRTTVLVFASHPYSEHDYIRNYHDFLNLID